MTAFVKGEEFVAALNAQGMVQGRHYVVVALDARVLPFGTFVSYQVRESVLCDACRGAGVVLFEERTVICDGCGGSGARRAGGCDVAPAPFWVSNLHLLGRKIATCATGGAS